MHKDVERILLSEEQIKARVAEIGRQITMDYEGKKPLLVSVLKGSVIFMADLMRAIDVDCEIDFMSVSSYGRSKSSSGVVRILKDLDHDITGKHIIVVEDILDSGLTLSYILDMLKSRGAASLRLCTLLDKPERRRVSVAVDYSGFTVPDDFVVGYGLDYDETYRNLPYIGILKPEVYTK
ncbi:MAG: hypoxanthine phosphoribosyltransferase [Clostridia bacterium]|nr:hypoxanthine phosphoribosyltransferase [Clostridia bacterium]